MLNIANLHPSSTLLQLRVSIIQDPSFVQFKETIAAAILAVEQAQAARETESSASLGASLLLRERRGANAEVKVEVEVPEAQGGDLLLHLLLLHLFIVGDGGRNAGDGKGEVLLVEGPVGGRVYSPAQQLPPYVCVPVVLYLVVCTSRQPASNQ